jgi:hypothetical protein
MVALDYQEKRKSKNLMFNQRNKVGRCATFYWLEQRNDSSWRLAYLGMAIFVWLVKIKNPR